MIDIILMSVELSITWIELGDFNYLLSCIFLWLLNSLPPEGFQLYKYLLGRICLLDIRMFSSVDNLYVLQYYLIINTCIYCFLSLKDENDIMNILISLMLVNNYSSHIYSQSHVSEEMNVLSAFTLSECCYHIDLVSRDCNDWKSVIFAAVNTIWILTIVTLVWYTSINILIVGLLLAIVCVAIATYNCILIDLKQILYQTERARESSCGYFN